VLREHFVPVQALERAVVPAGVDAHNDQTVVTRQHVVTAAAAGVRGRQGDGRAGMIHEQRPRDRRDVIAAGQARRRAVEMQCHAGDHRPPLVHCTRTCIHAHMYIRLMALLSGTTRVSRYQKRKTNLDFAGARDREWQWHQLGHMQVCTSLQTDNHAGTPQLSFLQAGCSS